MISQKCFEIKASYLPALHHSHSCFVVIKCNFLFYLKPERSKIWTIRVENEFLLHIFTTFAHKELKNCLFSLQL